MKFAFIQQISSATFAGLLFFSLFNTSAVFADDAVCMTPNDSAAYASLSDYSPVADRFLGQCGPLSCSKPQSPFQIGGWIEAGLSVNNHGSTNTYDPNLPNGPASRNLDAFSGNSYLLGTEQQSDLKLNQAWLFINKQIDTQHGFDWGFRMDTCFGTDAKFGQCFGDQSFDYDWGTGDYNLGIFQLYGEFGYKNLKLRVGKFGSTMPYETICAPYNFFYSHTYSCYNTPLTFTGAVLEYTVNKQLSFSGGWTAGYHNSFENRFDDNGFLGNITFRPTDRVGFSYNLYLGRANGLNKQADAGTRYMRFYDTENNTTQTLVFTYGVTRKLTFINEWIWVENDYDNFGGGGIEETTRSYGLSQQLHYVINPCWSTGLRTEWLHAQGTIFDAAPLTGGDGTDLYEVSAVVNWKPNRYLHIQPELRYDWTDYFNGFRPFAGATESAQLTAACALIVNF